MAEANWQPSKAEYWKNLPSPARPWPSEVACYEKYVVEKKSEGKNDVLILGATVELRSMCHQHGMNVHIVDFSKKFFDILSKQHMVYTGPEIFYEQDWRTMELEKKFDLILGDWVPSVLHTNDYKTFFHHLLSHLKPDGLFIARECLRPDRNGIDLENVASKHYQQYEGKYSFYETSMQYVYAFQTDPVTAMWNIAAAQKALDDIHKKHLLKDGDYNFFVKALSVEKYPASVMVREDFEKQLEKYFHILSVLHGNDPGNEWFPIYVLKSL